MKKRRNKQIKFNQVIKLNLNKNLIKLNKNKVYIN